MRTVISNHSDDVVTVASAKRRPRAFAGRPWVCAVAVALSVGCAGSDPNSSSGAVAGSTGLPTAGSGSGSPDTPGGPAGAANNVAGSSNTGAGGSGDNVAGTSSASGGEVSMPAAGGKPASGGSGGAPSARGGAPSASGGGGSSSAGAPSGPSGPYPTTPPVLDKASKVPVSNPGAGYKTDANIAYGPETSQRLDVMYPTGAGPGSTQLLPMVLMFHGGAWVHSYTNNYGSGKDHMSTFFSRFLKHGFIVCNAEYRVNDSPAVDGAPAPAAVEDALLAAKWCWDYMDYYHADRTKFVVTGASAGGHLALMVGLTTPAAKLGPTSPENFKVAAIVDGYGPADIEAEINAVAKGWIPTNLPNRAAVAKLVNPMTYIRAGAPPMICVSGANDTTAPVRDSQALVDKLKAVGVDSSIHLVPGQGHGYTDTAAGWPDAEKAMFDWLVAKGIGK